MKANNFFQRFVHGCLVAAMPWALAFQPAIGHEAMKDVSKEISALRSSIVSAEVWLAPRNLETRGEVKEEDLRNLTCPYHATQKKDLDPLLDLLTKARIVEVASSDPYEMRIAVYLHTRTGTTIGIATSQDFNNAPASGLFNRSLPIEVRNGYEADLRAWAAQRESFKAYPCRK